MNDIKLSRVIDSMRLPLIFLVVIAHLVPFSLPTVKFSHHTNDIYILISELFSHHLARLSVRCYFLVSGFYFFNRYSGDIKSFFQKQLKSRFKSLVIPFIIWNGMMVLAVLVKHHVFMKLNLGPDEGYFFLKELNLYQIFWYYPINFPLWFVRDLICMILLTPLVYFFIKYFKHYGIIGLGILYLTIKEPFVPGISLTSVFFFSLGAYFAIENKDLLKVFDKLKYPALILMLLFLFISLGHNGQDIQEYYLRVFIICGVVSIFNLFNLLDNRYTFLEKLTGFSSLSFFIYVVHEIYIINWVKGFFFSRSLFDDGWGRLFAYFVIPLFCMAICTLIYYALMRIMPKYLVFSLGGRVPNFKTAEHQLKMKSK